MYAILDTETTSLFDFKKPADAEGQPRLAEMALILVDADLIVEAQHQIYIKPDGWEMSLDAGKINGLTTEFLMKKGVPVAEALNLYSHIVNQGRIIVAHNAQFDLKIMRGALRRAGMPDLFENTKNICTMRGLMGHVVKQDGKKGFPKLSDACAHFGIVLQGQHTAMGDALATLQLLKQMVALNIMPEAAVHYAKEQPAGKAGPKRTDDKAPDASAIPSSIEDINPV